MAVHSDSRLDPRLRRVMVEFNQMQGFAEDPLVIAGADGIRLRDVDGRSYIDGLSGVFAVSVGHGNAEVIDAIARQHAKVAFASPIMTLTEPALEFAERVCELTNGRASALKQYCAGSESTEAAIKIARQFHHQNGDSRRFKIVSFYRAFHGTTLGALGATGHPVLQTPFHPIGGGFVHVHPPIRHDWPGAPDEATCADHCLALMRNAITGEGPETIAAIMVEPLMLSAGGYELPPGFLVSLRELCEEIGALLIVDEIITGFGRLGDWFAADLHGTWPDLMTIGKGVSGGYAPLSCVLMAPRVADTFWGAVSENRQFQDGHTFASNPISAAVGLAVIEYMVREKVIEHVAAAGPRFGERLREIATRYPIIEDIRGRGLLWVLDLAPGAYSRRGKRPAALGSLLHQFARRHGLLIRASRTVVQIAPPLVTTEAELDEIASILELALEDLVRAVDSGEADRFVPAFSL